MLTAYHAKFFAYDLTKQAPPGAADQLSMALFDASVDLNPHQIEAAMFALQSPVSEGVILADEVGLGKTIEAGIVLCQKWAERKRKLLIICPASIRQQWAAELSEKFSLPAIVLDAKTYRDLKRSGQAWPLDQNAIVILSFQYAARLQDELRPIAWDLVVIDEAHKLRNAYRPSSRIGQALRWAIEGRKKVLLTATPLQNSLMELFGLATFIDENMFGDANSFRSKYVNAGGNLGELRLRLADFCKRTLRKQVLEYVRYTQRKAITQPFRPTDAEQAFYDEISRFLQAEDSYAIPSRQRHLTALILRKLLASSSHAIAGTLDTLGTRLGTMRDGRDVGTDWAEEIITAEEIEEELLEEWLEDEDEDCAPFDPTKLRGEIELVSRLADQARAIGTDTKTHALLKALEIGFAEQERMGAAQKALIFTESRRTQDYLRTYLKANGYAGRIVTFSGTNSGDQIQAIYENWRTENEETGRSSGSKSIDIRAALIDYFRDEAQIMIATEAAAEGVNLQFCSMVINYDLPWNPQRIEQRIGRCHRYGQTHDVIVINFLNERNQADQRVYELLRDKFSLFSGVFGASDEVLGSIESGVDFEKRILAIYQECRSPEAIKAAFDALQDELEEQIRARMDDTRRALLEHFDEDVHARLKLRLEDTRAQLDRVGKRFWDVTRFILDNRAQFDEAALAFDLEEPPSSAIPKGRYHLISRASGDDANPNSHGHFLYRLSHPLGEKVIEDAKCGPTPVAKLVFDVSHHQARNAVVEGLRGRSGWLTLRRLSVTSFETEEYLLFSGADDSGTSLDQEACEKLFAVGAMVKHADAPSGTIDARIAAGAEQAEKAALNRSLEANSQHFANARDKLEQWAEDKIFATERALKDTKEQIKTMRRQSRAAATLEEEEDAQRSLAELERKQRKQRQEIFSVEDDIAEKRDALISALQKRMQRGQQSETLFTIRWSVV